jgi:hypothetical protein
MRILKLVDDTEAVGRLEVIEKLLATCPHLRERWQESRIDDDEEPLPYPQAAALAEVVVEAFQAGDTQCFTALFAEVEEAIASGAPDQIDLATVGFLEDLQGALGWAGLEVDAMEPWLGPQAKEAWIALLNVWTEVRRKKATGDLPRGPFDAAMPEVEDPELRRIFHQVYRPAQRDDN